MRHREKGGFTNALGHVTVVNVNCLGQTTNTADVVVGKRGTFQKTDDVVTPNFSRRIARGEIIMNPFDSSVVTHELSFDGPKFGKPCGAAGTPFVTYEFSKDFSAIRCGVSEGKLLFSSQEVTAMREIAATTAWSKIKKSDVQILVTLFEIRRTLLMLRDPLGNITKFLHKVRRDMSSKGSHSQGLNTAQYLAREWLTYRYGWSQLYRDTLGVLKAIERVSRSGILKTSGSYEMYREEFTSASDTLSSSVVKTNYQIQNTDLVRVRAGIFYEETMSTTDYLGINITELIDVGWEILPYSFVVDWVFGVQTYLKALIRSYTTRVRGSFVTTNRYLTSVSNCLGTVLTPGGQSGGWSVLRSASGTYTTVVRLKQRTPCVPPPSLNMDSKINSLIDIRILDSLSLIINLLKKK